MEWGSHLKELEMVAKRGIKVDALENRPVLYDDLCFVWGAFLALHRTRPRGFSMSPIPIQDVATWLDLHRIKDHDLRLEIYEIISALDSHWMTNNGGTS